MYYLAPQRARAPMSQYARDIGSVFTDYLRGLLIVSTLYGIATMIALACLSLIHRQMFAYVLLIGVAGGILYAVPYIGPLVTAAVTFLVAFSAGGLSFGIIAIIVTLIVNQIFDNVITPRVVGGGVGLSPVASLFALTLGGTLFGLWGLLLSVPVAASIQAILFRLFPKLTTPTPDAFLRAQGVSLERRSVLQGDAGRCAAHARCFAPDNPDRNHGCRAGRGAANGRERNRPGKTRCAVPNHLMVFGLTLCAERFLKGESMLRSLFHQEEYIQTNSQEKSVETLLTQAASSAQIGTAQIDLGDALGRYEHWPAPVVIVSDGAYGVSGFPGGPADTGKFSRLVRAAYRGVVTLCFAVNNAVVLGSGDRMGNRSSSPGAARLGIPRAPHLGQGPGACRRQCKQQNHTPLPCRYRSLRAVCASGAPADTGRRRPAHAAVAAA